MSALPSRLSQQAEQALARRSPLMVAFFSRIFAQALARDFHAVRLSRAGPRPDPGTPRLVVYSNHPSWWDAPAYALLARTIFTGRAGYAPVDAKMLGRYGFMARIGAFGVAQDSHAGAAFFLAAAAKILERPEGLLFVTAQGRFADARERPVALRPGLAHLAGHAAQASFLPLALDYVFWDERKPELLMRFGRPLPAASLLGLSIKERNAALGRALEETMDALAAEAIARDPAAFDTLLQGRIGVGGVYDLWRRARAFLRGGRFSPAHGGNQ